MRLIWQELQAAVPLIFNGNPYLLSIVGFTLQVAVVATAGAAVIGVPLGLAIGLERFPGRGVMQALANAGLALPPVLVGLGLFMIWSPGSVFGNSELLGTRRAVFIAQTILALPYVIALTAAAVQGLGGSLLAQARALGAGRTAVWTLALREARVGVVAGLLAALGTAISEVGAVVIVGGNAYGYDQTLASAALFEADGARYADAVALGIVLLVMILVLMCALGFLQQAGPGVRPRFRAPR